MKKEILLHTPEGVRDIYGAECTDKVKLQRRLSQVLSSYGYKRIQTPTFEFFAIFNGERGTVKSREMYKFFDREGNTLVLRPDITPSIARAVAKYYSNEQIPLRFCYIGNVFINNSSYQGLMKESTQMGAELIGDDSAQADAELIVLSIMLMKKAGLKKFVVDIGHAGFLKALMEEAGLDADSEENLKELIENKNFFGIENLMEEKQVTTDLRNVLMELPRLSGSWEILQKTRSLTTSERALSVIDRLEKVYHAIRAYDVEDYVTFDLGMLTNYDYYTGVIFRGYTYGTGDSIVKGGRYDRLVGQFGKDAPAVGFALEVDQLIIALRRQKIDITQRDPAYMVLYDEASFGEAVKRSGQLRDAGFCVTLTARNEELSIEDYRAFCRREGILKILELRADSYSVTEVG